MFFEKTVYKDCCFEKRFIYVTIIFRVPVNRGNAFKYCLKFQEKAVIPSCLQSLNPDYALG